MTWAKQDPRTLSVSETRTAGARCVLLTCPELRASSCARAGVGWILGKSSPWKGLTAQSSGGITISGGISKLCECGTWGCDLVSLAELG